MRFVIVPFIFNAYLLAKMNSNPILTIQELIDYGFKEYPKNSHDNFDRVWQYCVKDKIGKKFFVNVRFWEFSKYTKPDHIVYDSFDATCQFDGSKCFDVSIIVSDMKPYQIIDWFDRIFYSMNCIYYECYDEPIDDCITISNCKKCGLYLDEIYRKELFLCHNCDYTEKYGFIPR